MPHLDIEYVPAGVLGLGLDETNESKHELANWPSAETPFINKHREPIGQALTALRGRWQAQGCVVKCPRVGVSATYTYIRRTLYWSGGFETKIRILWLSNGWRKYTSILSLLALVSTDLGPITHHSSWERSFAPRCIRRCAVKLNQSSFLPEFPRAAPSTLYREGYYTDRTCGMKVQRYARSSTGAFKDCPLPN